MAPSFWASQVVQTAQGVFVVIVLCLAAIWLVGAIIAQWLPPSGTAAAAPKRGRSRTRRSSKGKSKERDPVEEEEQASASDSSDEEEDEEEEEEEESLSEEEGNVLRKGLRLLNRCLTVINKNPQKAIPSVFAVAVVAMLFYSLIGGPKEATIDATGLGPVLVHQGAAWHPAHYYMPPFFLTKRDERVPYVACHHYPLIEQVHTKHLGRRLDESALAASGVVSEHAVDKTRDRGLLRCVIERDAIVKIDQHESGHEAHLKRKFFWELPSFPDPQTWLVTDTEVTHIFLTETRERFYRVVMVTNPTAADSKQKLQPVLVAESDLVNAAANWYHNQLVMARMDDILPHPPCICDAHFGLINSGISFHYDEASNSWRIRLGVEIVRNLTKSHETRQIHYAKQIPFPLEVNKAYNIGQLSYYERVEVRYINTEDVTDAFVAKTAGSLDGPNDALGLAAVMNLAQLVADPRRYVGNPIVEKRQVAGRENDCIQYCLALNAGVLRRFAPAAVDNVLDSLVAVPGGGGLS